MLKKFTLTTLGIVAIAGFLIGTKMLQFRAMAAAGAHMTMPAETVTATAAREMTWSQTVAVTGSVAPVQGVTIGAEVAGKVAQIAFEAGALVQAGDLLVKLDTSTEEAQLRAVDASAELARLNLDRSRDLAQKGTISKSEFDLADAQFKQSAAQADNLRAVIAKKSIRAPFSGRLGLRLINLGQILKDGEAIATLQTLDPVYVNFSVPQQRLSVLTAGGLVHVTTDAAPGEVFEGKINAISPEIDATTRNVRVQATVPNRGERLRAGMFANVEAVLPQQDNVIVIPATAVLYAPYGDSIFIVDEKKDEKTGQMNKVLRQQFIRLGRARGDFVAVSGGLKAGEMVVTSGVFKLRAGTNVVIDNTLAPKAELDPKPDNT